MNRIIKDPDYDLEFTVFPIITIECPCIDGEVITNNEIYRNEPVKCYRVFTRRMNATTEQWIPAIPMGEYFGKLKTLDFPTMIDAYKYMETHLMHIC